MKDRRVIVNADDLGFSPAVNEGIVRAHLEGIVTSATISPNMPAAAAAVGLLSGLDRLGVGVHLNASQGPPLSAQGRELAGSDGQMDYTATGIVLACCLRPRLLDVVAAEFDAQIRWVLDHRIKPTHLDTHRHTHAFGPVFARVAALARRYNIRFVRRHREPLDALPASAWPGRRGPQAAMHRGLDPRRCVSRILTVLGAANAAAAPQLHGTSWTLGVAHTGMIDSAWLIRAARTLRPGVTEIMTHPGLAEAERPAGTRLASRQAELAALCDPQVKEAFRRRKVTLVHYGQL
jgi:predicted glycoside hydrolase/deacetylase ChbG (UPF0249 family)